MIEHLVDGLAVHMRFAAASRAGGAIGCAVCEIRTLLISRLGFAVNSISIPVIG